VLAACLAGCGSVAVSPNSVGADRSGHDPGAGTSTSGSGINNQSAAAQSGERYDPQAEQTIGVDAVHAWRTAVAHQKKAADQSESEWQKQRAEDEQKSMDELRDLARRFPTSSTVHFMMGQVEAHFGKPEEARKYFQMAREKNTNNGMALFKLAETERQLGKMAQASDDYRALIKLEPSFYPARLGLAECLLKSKPPEARQLAQSVIDDKNADQASLKRAEQIVSETKGGTASR
jgi:tetratricopeptide (TPR) repeat protein